MAHAVLVQRLIVGIAPLALLFLVVLGVLVLIAGFALLAKAVHRYRETDTRQAEFLASTLPDAAPLQALLDTEPGTNLADRDACELLIADDPEFAAHCERLWAAIRNQQKKEAGDA